MIKAILFDSGKVLNGPRSGHWFIGPKFYDFIDKDIFDNIESAKINKAFREAQNYMNSVNLIQTAKEELDHFMKFYEIFSNCLPELKLSPSQIKGLAEDLVFNPQKYVFYEDALKVIPILKEKYQLGIVSDAWPSLKNVYDEVNLTSYFETFVISSIIGVVKPDPLMYTTALNELGITAEEAIFIDDNFKNCLGAREVGMQAILLCRDKKIYVFEKARSSFKGYKVIKSLEELKKY